MVDSCHIFKGIIQSELRGLISQMKIKGFIWLADIVDKIEAKHRLTIQEVEDLFSGKPLFSKMEKGRVKGEDVYRALGQTKSGKYVAAFFIYKVTAKALIISARVMTARERKYYAKKRQ